MLLHESTLPVLAEPMAIEDESDSTWKASIFKNPEIQKGGSWANRARFKNRACM